MPRRYTKAIIQEAGKIKTFSSVKLPALLPSYQNRDVFLMRVGVFGRRYIKLKKSSVFTFPIGELEKPDIIIGIADIIEAEKIKELDEEIEYNKELEIENTRLKNQIDELYTELRKVRTTSTENVAEQIEVVMSKFVEMQKALRPMPKKGGRI